MTCRARPVRFASRLLAAAAFTIAATAASAGPLPLLRITDLDAAIGKGPLRVADINNSGVVLSYSYTFEPGPTCLWHPESGLREITVPDATLTPTALNDRGQVAGYSIRPGTGEGTRPFVWDPVLGLKVFRMSSDLHSGEAMALNNRGQIAGSGGARGQNSHLIFGLARGVAIDLQPEQRGHSYGQAINNAGHVAGSSTDPGRMTAILIGPHGRVQKLGSLAEPAEESEAFGLNDNGQVVGKAEVGNRPHAFIWSEATGMVDLGQTPNSSGWSTAHDINTHGQVVGGRGDPTFSVTYYWDAEHGGIDLNDRLDPADPLRACTVIIAPSGLARINDLGQIITTAKIDGFYRSVLLTPTNP